MPVERNSKKRKITTAARLRFLCLTLIALGLAVSGYLLSRHLALASAGAQDGLDVCSALFGTGCDAALRSAVSIQFGIPLAGWGVVYYTTLAVFLLLAWVFGKSFKFEATLAALVLSVVAALAGVGLVVTMLVGQFPFCPLCAVVHTINLVLVFPLKRMTGRPIPQLLKALAEGGMYLLAGKTADPAQARWKLLGFFTVALSSVVLYQWVVIETMPQEVAEASQSDDQEVLATYQESPRQVIPIDVDDPRLGPSHAPIQLVVFSDFRCPSCRSFSDRASHLARRFRENLQIVFKHFPLGKACNRSVIRNFHPRSCEAAWAAEAARRQGRFWSFHDALFSSDLTSGQNTVSQIAKALMLDLQRFEADRNAEATMAKVKGDVELGIRLGVNSTPAVFLNGRRVYDFGTEMLEFLITLELQVGGN